MSAAPCRGWPIVSCQRVESGVAWTGHVLKKSNVNNVNKVPISRDSPRHRKRTPTLVTVAEQAKVPLLTAYQALANADAVDATTQTHVRHVASELGYTLRVTMRDVAELAGVSVSTTSYVLNANQQIQESTRRRVEEAIEALGYHPDSTARNLKSSETRLIGYAWHQVQDVVQRNPILDHFLYEMAQTAESWGYHVLTFAQSGPHDEKSYENLIRAKRVDGFVLSDTVLDDPRILSLKKLRFPFVAFGSANPDWDFPYVDDNGREGMTQVVNHLLAQGHTHIAMLSWPEGNIAGDSRVQGYRNALAAAGITADAAVLVRTANNVADAQRATQGILSAAPRPTAIVCATDIMATAAMLTIQEAGLVVGQDIALTGYDDSPVAAVLGLTSVRQQLELIARAVVATLLADIRGTPRLQRHTLIEPQLIVRASSQSVP